MRRLRRGAGQPAGGPSLTLTTQARIVVAANALADEAAVENNELQGRAAEYGGSGGQ